MVRVFLGIMLPKDIIRYAIGIQRQLQSSNLIAKFVEKENLHISLSFLGDVSVDTLTEMGKRLDNICHGFKKFNAKTGDFIFIPSKNYVRVIALMIESDYLDNLRKEIVKSFDGNSNTPHLTLCRVKSVKNKMEFFKTADKIKLENIFLKISSVSIIESKLGKSGPSYNMIHNSSLE